MTHTATTTPDQIGEAKITSSALSACWASRDKGAHHSLALTRLESGQIVLEVIENEYLGDNGEHYAEDSSADAYTQVTLPAEVWGYLVAFVKAQA